VRGGQDVSVQEIVPGPPLAVIQFVFTHLLGNSLLQSFASLPLADSAKRLGHPLLRRLPINFQFQLRFQF